MKSHQPIDPISAYLDRALRELAWAEQHCAELPVTRGKTLKDLRAIRDEQELQQLARKPRLVWSRD